VRYGQCQPRGTVLPTPVWLTRRALEGGPATPSNSSLMNLQGQTMITGQQDAIPATVGPVRPPPCLRHHAGYCYNNSSAVGHAGTERRHVCHCTPYGSPSMASLSPSEDATANHYAFTLEAAPVQVRDAPRRQDRGKDRQDGRQLPDAARHTPTCSQTVRHACNSPSPWSIKGR
jgi:hypothetical protein